MNERYELLAIGGGPAGMSAVRGYRDAGGEGAVAIVTDEYRMPYNRPPLTKELLRGEASEDGLPLEEEHWLARLDVGLIGGRAVAIDSATRTVTLSGGRELRYRECVLATGAEPTRLPVPGADDPGVSVVRTLDHVRDLLVRLDSAGTKVAVIGSGFIGCEIASSLRMRGHPVTLISDEHAPNLARLGADAAAIIAGWLSEDGVELQLGAEVDGIERDGDELTVLAGEERISAGVVVMAAGVAPRSELAQFAAIALESGAIPVTAAMRSTREGVLAAGDVCLALNVTAGRALRVEHWGDALTQGEIAGRTAAGADAEWTAVPGFWSTIGSRTLKYAAWGDGFEQTQIERHGAGFTARYGQDGRLVGVLAHEADDDYERGSELIAEGARWKS
jgi:3-phenylpropionate/trans-cinnamate dioxygenase ferredoxin reductase component